MKKLILITFLFLTCLSAFGQEDRLDSLLNNLIYSDTTLFQEKDTSIYDFVYSSLMYNNKTYYAGREVGTNINNASGFLYYFHSSGLFAGISGLWYDQISPGYYSTSLSIGYLHAIDKKKHFTFKTYYSRFIYNTSDTVGDFPYTNNVNLSLSFHKKWYGARMSGNYLFGNESSFNFYTTLYTHFYFLKFGKNNKFYFGPEISGYFSDEDVYLSSSSTSTTNVFGFMNAQLYVPLAVELNNFELQFSYTLNVPYTQDVTESYSPSSSINASVAYMLPIEKKHKKKQ